MCSSDLLALVTLAIAGTVIVGWVTRDLRLTRFGATEVSMRVNTALGLTLLGLAVVLCTLGRSLGRFSAFLFGAVALLGLAQLAQVVAGVDLGIDEALWRDFTSGQEGVEPGRMAVTTALSFVLLGVGGALRAGSTRQFRLAQVAVGLAALLAVNTLFAYAYQNEPLMRFGEVSPMALPTALGVGTIAVALVYASPQRGLGQILLSSRTSGTVLRRMLPILLIVPMVLGWIAMRGHAQGQFTATLALTLISTGQTLVILGVLAWTVSAMRRGEQALDRAVVTLELRERVFRSSFENAFVGMAHVGSDGRWLRANAFLLTLLECTRAQLTQANIRGFLREDGQADLFRRMRELIDGTREPITLLLEWLTSTGQPRSIETQISVIEDEAGGFDYFVLVMQDVTQELAREERLRIRTRSLEVAKVSLIIADARSPDLPIIYVNSAFEELTGYSAEEVLGQNCRFLNRNARDQASLETLRRALANAEEGHVTVLNHTKALEPIWIDLSITPVRDEHGTLTHFIGVQSDITERVRFAGERESLLEAALEARNQAEEAAKARASFLAVVSHELRSPLNSIRLWTSLLREQDSLDGPFVARATQHIERSVELQGRLVDDMLDVSRITSGILEIELEPLELGEIVRNTVDELRPRAEGLGIELRLDFIGDGAVDCEADPQRIQQVVRNLVENALKFTPPDGRVDVAVAHDPEQVTIAVSDTGRGLTAEETSHVFERFWQAEDDSARGFAGLGLGLSIVKHVVDAHAGTIDVESPGLGHGATFRVRIPRHRAGSRPASRPAARVHPRPAARPRSGPGESVQEVGGVAARAQETNGDVLVVDDDAATAEALALALAMRGHSARIAKDVESARREIALRRPRLVISDLMMPGVTGIEFVQGIRSEERESGLARIGALAISGRGNPSDRREILEAGFDAFLPKPVNIASLFQWVDAWRAP